MTETQIMPLVLNFFSCVEKYKHILKILSFLMTSKQTKLVEWFSFYTEIHHRFIPFSHIIWSPVYTNTHTHAHSYIIFIKVLNSSNIKSKLQFFTLKRIKILT